ncbi:MAG: bifunctional diguanylate cyclase/phosphodiesterase [Campylobacterota bacterium]|nr:bifunctional diguanylate cyclase/phosphodiesterase [Campylobacterota bacterium]
MQYDEIFEDTHLLELFNFGICVVDYDLEVKYWNSWLSFVTKIRLDDIKTKNIIEFFPEINKSKLKRQIKAAITIDSPTYFSSKDGYLFKIELDEITNPNYEYMQQLITIYPITNNNVIISIQDQTSLKEANSQVKQFTQELEKKRKLYIDKLTNLPNRNKLLEDLENCSKSQLGLLNIDGFSEINDFYGFEIGDLYLIDIGSKLLNLSTKYNYKLYKLPSDEYAIFNFENDTKSNDTFIDDIKKILQSIEDSFYEDKDNTIAIYLSCGISFEDINLLKTADIALNHSRKMKKNFVIYDESISINKHIKDKHKWLSILKKAIKEDRIQAFYQPIYNIKTQKVEKYETLVRLIAEDGKVISPFFFLDIAKQAKLYNQITAIVINQSFEKFKDTNYEFSINISVEDIEHIPTVNLILDKLKNNPNIASRLVIELLEDEGIENFDMINSFITSVKSYGTKIAIDDFGTGYSNFSYLLKLNVDYLKIDASLIKNIDNDENSKKIVNTLVDFSKKIDAKTIGEFVHSKNVLNEIIIEDIDYAQGFYIDQPRKDIGEDPRWEE